MTYGPPWYRPRPLPRPGQARERSERERETRPEAEAGGLLVAEQGGGVGANIVPAPYFLRSLVKPLSGEPGDPFDCQTTASPNASQCD